MTFSIILLAFLSSQPDNSRALSADQPASIKLDILVKQPSEECPTPIGDEIVVCATEQDNEVHRLRPIANAAKYDKDESRAEFNISENVQMAAEVDGAQLGGGVTSKRIMARVKVKF